MLYLAETHSCFLPTADDSRERAVMRTEVMSWLCWQLSGLGPIQGQAHAFNRYVPEDVPYAKARFSNELARLYEVLDSQLEDKHYVAGDYSVADMALYPWVSYHRWANIESIDDLPNLASWVARVGARPAVQRGMQHDGQGKRVEELIQRAEQIRQVVAATTLDTAKS